MSISRKTELRRQYLQKLYELSGGNPREWVSMDQVEEGLNAHREECYEIVDYLRSKDLLEAYPNRLVRITFLGADQVESLMESSYAEKEQRVLQKIYGMGGIYHTDWVIITELVNELDMAFREVNDILIDLEKRKGLIEGMEEVVKMNPAGIQFIEQGGRDGRVTNITYNTTNIHGSNYGSVVQGGQGHTQNSNINAGSSNKEE